MGSKSNESAFIREEEKTGTEAKLTWKQKERPDLCGHKPRDAWIPQKLEDKERFSPRAFESSTAQPTPRLWNHCLQILGE